LSVSTTTIVNRALSKLGAGRVTSIDDDSRNARACKAAFDAVRDAELRKAVWSFAAVRTTLEADVDAPAWGFSYRYLLPADCLRVLQVNDYEDALQGGDYRDASAPPYALEGGYVLTDLPAPLKLRYVKRQDDAAMFDPLFAEALACALAAEIAPEVTESDAKRAFAAQQYVQAMRDARRLNAVEKPSEAVADDSWVMGRL
jgi:hypothetical protein